MADKTAGTMRSAPRKAVDVGWHKDWAAHRRCPPKNETMEPPDLVCEPPLRLEAH